MQPEIDLEKLFKQRYKNFSSIEIKEMRNKIGISMTEFGDLFFASKDTVKGWESGRRNPSCSTVRLLQFVSIIADKKHKDINHRIRQAYK